MKLCSSDNYYTTAPRGDLVTEHFNKEMKRTPGPFLSGHSTDIYLSSK